MMEDTFWFNYQTQQYEALEAPIDALNAETLMQHLPSDARATFQYYIRVGDLRPEAAFIELTEVLGDEARYRAENPAEQTAVNPLDMDSLWE